MRLRGLHSVRGVGVRLSAPPAPPDRDSIGTVVVLDRCPSEREVLNGWQDEDGCPDVDNDLDGILDLDDLCPMEPEDVDGNTIASFNKKLF